MAELMNLDINSSKGYGEKVTTNLLSKLPNSLAINILCTTFYCKYRDSEANKSEVEGKPVEESKSPKKEIDKKRFQDIIFVLDRSKPEILRFDVIKKSRIKISVVFTEDQIVAFPSLFQFVFIKDINRMFVIGGSNSLSNEVENWRVAKVS